MQQKDNVSSLPKQVANQRFKKLLSCTFICLCSITPAKAQTTNFQIGARQMGLAYASSCLKDEWAIFNNPSGIAKLNAPAASFTYDAVPSFKPFNRVAAVLALPTNLAGTGIGVFRFGDNVYNEECMSAAIANKLGLASLGLRFNYVQYHAEGFGTYRALSVSFGGIAEITKVIHVGALINNINQPMINKAIGEQLPVLMTLALAALPSEKIMLSVEVQKDTQHAALVKAGMEYGFYKKFKIRSGFNLGPQAVFFGFGFKSRRILVDYGLRYNPALPMNHQCTVSYPMSRK